MKPNIKFSRALYQSMKILVCLIGLSGCTHYYYVPNAHNVPLIQEKHEARISVGACAGDEYSGGDFQAALSVSDHVGIMVNGFIAKGEKEYEKWHPFNWSPEAPEIIHNTGSGQFVEFGTGYYLPIPHHDRLVFETYGGLGFGKVLSGYNSLSSSLKFQRYFLQPSIGFTGKVFDIAFSYRFSLLNYTDINYKANIPHDEALYLNNLVETNLSLLSEPALTIRLGYENVKFQLQLGFSKNASIPEFRNNFNFNIGVFMAITDKYNMTQ
ncbi:hypothetical protein ACFLTU_08725 [Bacteroidota bacterium]